MVAPCLLWDELRWTEIRDLVATGCDLAVLPVGATEQHGPHLPCNVDSLCAEAIARAAAASCGVPVLPTLSYGVSLGHTTRWPGTLSLRPATLAAILCDLGEWLLAAGFTRLVILNGHYTNWAPLRCGLEDLRHRDPSLRLCLRSLWDLSPALHARYHADAASWHANRAETSLMLHLRPDLVRMDLAADSPDRNPHACFAWPVSAETETGVVGCPIGANAAEGEALFAELVSAASALISRAKQETPPLATHF